MPTKKNRKSEHLELETLDTFAMIRKCWAKTSVESFVPSLQWSPSRFVTGWCHRGKNFWICQFFSASEKQDKICTVQTSNLTSDVRRLFTRWRGFPPSIVQPLFYSVHVMVARCEGSIKRKTRVTQEHFVLSGEMDQAPSRMLRNIIHVNDALTLSTDKIVHFHEL